MPDRPNLERQLEQSGYGAPRFAELYDAYRPRPPRVLLDVLPQLARVDRPALVVDLGSGTGLSTRVWADRADEIVGVEPNAAMRAFAEAHTDAPNVRYPNGSSYEIPVADAGADIVTASQSLQWMEPTRTLAEVARVLRPGGIFCAYQYDDLVTAYWEPEAQFHAVLERAGRVGSQRGLDEGTQRWPVRLERFEQSGHFRRARQFRVHSVEEGNANRLVGFAFSTGTVQSVLARGVSEAEIGLDALREAAERTLGDDPSPWYFTYRVVVGLK